MQHNEIINCPRCQERLRLPSDLGLLNVTCPKCLHQFLWKHDQGIIIEHEQQAQVPKNYFTRIVLPISLMFLVGLILIISYSKENFKNPVKVVREPKWITISYADLIDGNAIIRTGDSLKSALHDQNLRGAIQPFLDPYSFLLQHAMEMLSGPNSIPYRNVADAYPLGSPQPAWVSIFRGGRIQIITDHKNHARLFLLGDNPEESYQTNYPIIRHCLNALLPPDGSPLNIEVFTYSNDYKNAELHLNLTSRTFSASVFPTKGVPLDIAGLEAFFNENPEIQGAKLDHSKGLILFGKLGQKQTLAGANISLSDLAVAYRAVFHAGDNDAFISLDPHIDPTKVTVNFGGFLEDTRIGSVVLEADKRFKTITGGLDPNKFKDLRQYTRQYVPSFLTVAEQDLIFSSHLSKGQWIGTRFWFYPDSIGIESDLNYQYSLITNPLFMADAERSREDFASPEDFQTKKGTTLSPSIRRNIDHLNQNYFEYAQAFTELKELTTVARLMGICSWLYKASPRWLDLDALLSIELPPVRTTRDKTKLVSACIVSYSDSQGINQNYVLEKSKVVYLSPILEKKVSDHFINATNFSKYLCIKNGEKEDTHKIFESEAFQLFPAQGNLKVREIIKTKEDLRALASYTADSLQAEKPLTARNIENDLKLGKELLQKLEAEIDLTKRKLNSTENPQDYNLLVDHHNELILQYKSTLQKYNQDVNIYNSLKISKLSILEIGGGINLEPRNFKIKASQPGPKMQGFLSLIDKVDTKWRPINGAGKWIRNETGGSITEGKTRLPKMVWKLKKEETSGVSLYKHLQSDNENQYWFSSDSRTGSWRDCQKMDKVNYLERSYDKDAKKFQIAKFYSGRLQNHIVGQIEKPDRIVFRKSERKDILKPKDPPIWFINN